MHTEVSISLSLLYSFMLALARVSGFLLLAPLPGLNAGPSLSRVVLSLALTACLIPRWPVANENVPIGDLVLWVVAEFALGFVTGIALSLLLEAFQVAGQAIGVQAGFSYASTVDPSTQADTAVLQTVLQLLTGFLFFAIGLHHHVLKLLSIGLDVVPNGGAIAKAFNAEAIIRLGSLMFTTGLRLAMPVMGFLLLIDLAFALLSKVHAQLQLLSFSFSVKMLAGLAIFAGTLALCPAMLQTAAVRTFEILQRLLT